ncbi:MAG TPA: hypothetical protein VER96_08140 [Polyangiaceae bacterium]|nr:hypothetical protein [Polyangiaceae bacterium]
MKAFSLCLFAALFSTLSLPAWAADEADDSSEKAADAPKEKAKEKEAEAQAEKPAAKDPFAHHGQFGLRVGLVGGYNMIFRYDDSPLCTPFDPMKSLADQQKFCGHGAPLAIDIAASFAPLDFVEPYIFTRLGLSGETQTDTLPVKIVGVGARLYTMSDSAFKIFIDPAVAMEFEGSANTVKVPGSGYNPQYKNDLLLHLAAGPQFDLARYVGIFLDAGLTTGILRGIHTTLELQGGVQARFP